MFSKVWMNRPSAVSLGKRQVSTKILDLWIPLILFAIFSSSDWT